MGLYSKKYESRDESPTVQSFGSRLGYFESTCMEMALLSKSIIQCLVIVGMMHNCLDVYANDTMWVQVKSLNKHGLKIDVVLRALDDVGFFIFVLTSYPPCKVFGLHLIMLLPLL